MSLDVSAKNIFKYWANDYYTQKRIKNVRTKF